MRILNVEHRIFAAFFCHLGIIKLQRLIIAPGQHDKAHHISPDSLHHIPQRHKGSRPL